MYKLHVFTYLILYILSRNGWNLVQSVNPGRIQASGAQPGVIRDVPFRLINVDIKDKFSTNKCHYEVNTSQRRETFTPFTPYFIDKVTKNGKVIWDSADFNYYGARVLLARDANNKLVFKVFTPGFQDEEEHKEAFKPELEYVSQQRGAVPQPQAQMAPGVTPQHPRHTQPEVPKPPLARAGRGAQQAGAAPTHQDRFLPETDTEAMGRTQTLKAARAQKEFAFDSGLEVMDKGKASTAQPRSPMAPQAVPAAPHTGKYATAYPAVPEVQGDVHVSQRGRAAGRSEQRSIPIETSGSEYEISGQQQRARRGPQTVEQGLDHPDDEMDVILDPRAGRPPHTAVLPPTEPEQPTMAAAKGPGQSQLAAESSEFNTVLVNIDINRRRSTQQLTYFQDPQTGAHVFTPNPGHAIYMASLMGNTVWKAKDERYPCQLLVTTDENGEPILRAIYEEDPQPSTMVPEKSQSNIIALDVREYWDQNQCRQNCYDAVFENDNIIYFFKEGIKCQRVICDKREVWKTGDNTLLNPDSVSFDRNTYIVVVSSHDFGLEYHFNGNIWILGRILQYETEAESETEMVSTPKAKGMADAQQQPMGAQTRVVPGMVRGQHAEVWPKEPYGQTMGFEGYVSQDEFEQSHRKVHTQAPMSRSGVTPAQDRHVQYVMGPDGQPVALAPAAPQFPSFPDSGQQFEDIEFYDSHPGVPAAPRMPEVTAVPMAAARSAGHQHSSEAVHQLAGMPADKGRGAGGKHARAAQQKSHQVAAPQTQPIVTSSVYLDSSGIPVVGPQDHMAHSEQYDLMAATVPLTMPPRGRAAMSSQFHVIETESDSRNFKGKGQSGKAKKGTTAHVTEAQPSAQPPSQDEYINYQQQQYRLQQHQLQQQQQHQQRLQQHQQRLQQHQLHQQQQLHQQLQQQIHRQQHPGSQHQFLPVEVHHHVVDSAGHKSQKLSARDQKEQQKLAQQHYAQQIAPSNAARQHYAQQYTQQYADQYAQYAQQYGQQEKPRKHAHVEAATVITGLDPRDEAQHTVNLAHSGFKVLGSAAGAQLGGPQPQPQEFRKMAVPEQQAQLRAQMVESQPELQQAEPKDPFEGFNPPQEDADDLQVVESEGSASHHEHTAVRSAVTSGHMRAQPVDASATTYEDIVVED